MAIQYVEQIAQNSNYQRGNLWEFFIDDNENLKFLVTSTTLPFLQLTVEEKDTGEKFYSGYTPESSFSVDFLETEDFKVYNYFKTWQDQIYDPIKKVFKLNPPTKTGTLAFLGFESSGFNTLEFKVREVIKGFDFDHLTTKELETKVIGSFLGQRQDKVTTKEIVQSAFDMIRRQGINIENNIRSFLNMQQRQLNVKVKEQNKYVSSINFPNRREKFMRYMIQRVNQIVYLKQIDLLREKTNKIFSFKNLRLIKLGEISASYDTDAPLSISVELTADLITTESPTII